MSQTKAQLIDPVDGTIVNADINASAAIAGSKIDPDFGSQNIVTTGTLGSSDLTITSAAPALLFTETNGDPDYKIQSNAGVLKIVDNTNSADRFVINTDGHIDIAGNVDFGAGIDVTGGGLTVNTGTTNTCATFTSTDAGAVINITDNSARSSIEQNGTDLKIISDTDAGDASSTIKFLVDNSTKMTVDSSGKVHIGLTNGAGQFNVKNQDDSATNALEVYNDNGVRVSSFSQSSAGDASMDLRTNAASQTVLLRANGISHLSGGNVGIGTSSPSSLFHVKHDTTNAVAEFESGDANVSIKFKDNSTSTAPAIGATGDNLTLSTGGLERVNINGSTGRVGIGQAATGSPLHVYHATTNESIRCKSGDEYVHIGFEDSTTTNVPYMGAQGNHLRFITGGSERLRVQSGGGISFNGDTAAANALDDYEQGTYVPVVKNHSGGSAFSYDSDYELRSPHASGKTNTVAYTKIGNRVYLSFSLFFNTSGNSRVNISLPFGIRNDDYQCAGHCGYFSIASSFGVTFIGNSLNSIDLMENDSNGGHPNLDYTASSEVYLNFHYETN